MCIENLCQLVCVLYRIVFACNKSILKGNFATRACKICAAGVKKLTNPPTVVDGHNCRTCLIVGRVKRDRQRNGQILFHQHFDAVYKSASGKRNVTVTNVESCLAVNEVQEFDNVIVVIKRLSNTHQNDIGNRYSPTVIAAAITSRLGKAKLPTHIDVYAELLGHTVTDGELVKNTEDTAPYVGFGRVVTLMVGGNRKYRVKFTAKIKFAEPSADETTKGESTEFGTYELEGTILAPVDGDWQRVKDFDEEADAISYLEGLLGGAES